MTPKGDKTMKKHLPLILSAIMVLSLSLFTAVAIAAVNAPTCPDCGIGEEIDNVTTEYVYRTTSCSHGYAGATHSIELEYDVHHYSCTNCSMTSEYWELVSSTETCSVVGPWSDAD